MTRSFSRISVGIVLGLTVIFGIGLSAAYGQRNRNWDGYPNWGGSYDLRQTALNAGFNEGSKEGRNDRDRNRRSAYSSFNEYNKGTKDYSSRLGDRELYRRYFQLAFQSGYDTENPPQINNDRNRDRDSDRNRNDNNRDRDYDRNRNDNNRNDNNRNDNRRGRNWDRYGKYGGSYELRQTALNAGYNEGNKQGRNDRRKGRRSNYNDFSSYRDATTDYSSKLGDRELYRRYYREGFENGYEDGWNGY
jgi:hypothetical protein